MRGIAALFQSIADRINLAYPTDFALELDRLCGPRLPGQARDLTPWLREVQQQERERAGSSAALDDA